MDACFRRTLAAIATPIMALPLFGWAEDALPPEKLFPAWPPLWSSYNTHPKDCHLGLIDRAGRKILVGVETKGDPRSSSARQMITLLINERGFWTDPIEVSGAGVVFFPAMAVDQQGTVWIAWSEFAADAWHVKVRGWAGGRLSPAVQLTGASKVNLQPSLVALPSGELLAAWEAAVHGRFEIQVRAWKNGTWSATRTLSRGGEHEFRPVLAADSNGRAWIAWDRFSGGRYQTFAKFRQQQGWSREVAVFSPAQDSRDPRIAADHSGRVWILASGKIAGLDTSGQRFELIETPKWRGGPDFLSIDPQGRFWLFAAKGARASFDWMAAWRNASMAIAMVDRNGVHEFPDKEAALGYAAPRVDAEGNIWVMNYNQFLRFTPLAPPEGNPPRVSPAPPVLAASAGVSARKWPRYEVNVDGKPLKVWWAEMHNHLREQPADRQIASWVDRFYLASRYRDGLDVAALTDHDWPGVSRSMYYVEQGIASVANTPGRFLAVAGFEWSGDSQVRARYGDRTVLFPGSYFDIPRITDEASNTAEKLSRHVKQLGAIDWPHHIGRAESPVDPKYLNPGTEPVMEMTSGHGVFETYDPKHAVPVSYHTQIVPGTSVQDALAIGKRVGMVGSSDSHSGFSGYPVGMLAVVAPELTKTAILDAIRARRTYALRGGEPILVEFRANDHFMGEAFTSSDPVRIDVSVKGTKPVSRIDLVRNNRYILSRKYDDGGLERKLEFKDTEAPPAFYYVRVWQAPGEYAWTSPIWVDREQKASIPLPLFGLALLGVVAAGWFRLQHQRPD